MERIQDFDVPAEELWEAVTDPDRMGWLGDEVAVDVQPGGTGRITDDGRTMEVAVEAVDAGRRLSFRWWPEGQEDLASRVDLIVEPGPAGSRLLVRETLPVALCGPAALAQPHRGAGGPSAAIGQVTGWDQRLLFLCLATARPLALAGPRG